MSSGIAEHMGQRLTLVYAHVLPKIVVTTEILPASLDGTFMRLLVGVDRSYVPLQMFATGKTLVASINGTPVHPHVLLHTTLHDDHGRRWHPTPAGLLREVRHGHRRT